MTKYYRISDYSKKCQETAKERIKEEILSGLTEKIDENVEKMFNNIKYRDFTGENEFTLHLSWTLNGTHILSMLGIEKLKKNKKEKGGEYLFIGGPLDGERKFVRVGTDPYIYEDVDQDYWYSKEAVSDNDFSQEVFVYNDEPILIDKSSIIETLLKGYRGSV